MALYALCFPIPSIKYALESSPQGELIKDELLFFASNINEIVRMSRSSTELMCRHEKVRRGDVRTSER